MADTALAAQKSAGPRKAVAWAVASMIPARGPLSGSSGYSASACAISYDAGQTWSDDIKTSQAPNRTIWLAGVMAIRRVLELIDPGTILTIYVPNERLARCYVNKWINADGTLAEDFEAADAIYKLRDEFRLSLSVEYCKLDRLGNRLKVRAKEAAKGKTATLTPEDLLKVPVGKNAQDFNRTGGFPSVGADDEGRSGK